LRHGGLKCGLVLSEFVDGSGGWEVVDEEVVGKLVGGWVYNGDGYLLEVAADEPNFPGSIALA
jgi:hypothetical protein